MRKKKQTYCGAVDSKRLLADLESSDEGARLKALGSLCPCRSGWEIFEQHMDVVVRLKKDRSPRVRARALHISRTRARWRVVRIPLTGARRLTRCCVRNGARDFVRMTKS